MGSAQEDEDIIELVDVVEEGPELAEYLEEKFSIGETDFSDEPGLQDEWEIELASDEDSMPYKGHVEGVSPPELPNREIQTQEIPEETSEDQEIKRIGELEDKTVEGIIREVSREVIESVVMKVTPDITEAVIKAMNEKIERTAVDLFPSIAEKAIKEEIERLKEGGD